MDRRKRRVRMPPPRRAAMARTSQMSHGLEPRVPSRSDRPSGWLSLSSIPRRRFVAKENYVTISTIERRYKGCVVKCFVRDATAAPPAGGAGSEVVDIEAESGLFRRSRKTWFQCQISASPPIAESGLDPTDPAGSQARVAWAGRAWRAASAEQAARAKPVGARCWKPPIPSATSRPARTA